MICEFRLQLKNYDQEILTTLFNKEYHGKLAQAYAHSAYGDGKNFLQSDFCAGTIIDGSLLLIYLLQADTLICYVELEVAQDLKVVKKAINTYFKQIIRILDRNMIKWKEPEASIWIENIPFTGTIDTLSKRLKAVVDEKWEKLVMAPIASILASYSAIQFNILSNEDYIKDVKKAVILTSEAYIGLAFILIMQVLLKAYKKEFKFKI
jgi:hypothetical protein